MTARTIPAPALSARPLGKALEAGRMRLLSGQALEASKMLRLSGQALEAGRISPPPGQTLEAGRITPPPGRQEKRHERAAGDGQVPPQSSTQP